MIISIINHTHGKISDAELQTAIRAINRQISEDFEPYWGFGGQLRLEGASGKTPRTQLITDMRGDAVLYLWDKPNVKDALGYHEQNNAGIPYSFVFTELCKELGESWSVTLSHEVLELIGDPMCNLLVKGPHPEDLGKKKQRTVFHWFEMCDAVQSDHYEIDGIGVSNFVLPQYFTVGEQPASRNDFLGLLDAAGKPLPSFGVRPGGYIGFYDPANNKEGPWSPSSDPLASKRIQAKGKVGSGRGNQRKASVVILRTPRRPPARAL